jgi:uncharacterized membrane protein (DUF485 family)
MLEQGGPMNGGELVCLGVAVLGFVLVGVYVRKKS